MCLWVIFSLFIIIVYHFRLTSLHPKLLGGNDLAGGGLEDLALAPVLLDGLAGALGEGVGLDCEVLGGELLAPDDDLVDAALGLGGGPGGLEGVEGHGRSTLAAVHLVELEDVVFGLGVAGSHGLTHELGEAAVEGLLPSLEASAGGTAGAGLLAPHPEPARGTLACADSSALALLPLARSGSRLEVVEGEDRVLHVVQGGLVGLAALPVEHLHGEGRGGGPGAEGGGAGDEGGGEGGCWFSARTGEGRLIEREREGSERGAVVSDARTEKGTGWEIKREGNSHAKEARGVESGPGGKRASP